MEIVLIICTIIGGIAAVWFFVEKILPFFVKQLSHRKYSLKLTSPVVGDWRILKTVKALDGKGIETPSRVFSKEQLQGKEFAALLLSGSMLLEKSKGNIDVYIDISKSNKAIYTTASKRKGIGASFC